MWIKLLLLAAFTVVFILSLRAPRGARHLALRRVVMLTFGLFAAASVIFPEIWNTLARWLGVGRGSDLLLYTLIVACMLYVASSYLRFRELEWRVTLLARRIALDEAAAETTEMRHAAEANAGGKCSSIRAVAEANAEGKRSSG